jgi:hypothetical protein
VGASANNGTVACNCDDDDNDDNNDRIIVVGRRDAAAAMVAADILIILLSFSWISQGRSNILNISTILYCIVLTDCPLLKNCLHFHTLITLSSHFQHTFITLSSHFLIRPNRVISQFLVALIGEKLSLLYGTKNLLFNVNHKKVSHLALELVWAPTKFPPLSPPIQSPNQERRDRRESFLFLVECKKIFSAVQITRKHLITH